VTIEAEHQLLEETSGGFVDVSHPAPVPPIPRTCAAGVRAMLGRAQRRFCPTMESSIGRLSRWAFGLRDGCLSRLSVRERLGRGVAAVVTRLR